MNYQCPVCRVDLGKRKLDRLIVARMELDCPSCTSRLRLNVHPSELKIVLGSFAVFVALAAFGYWRQSEDMLLLALAFGMAGVLAVPLLERTRLKTWPRYVSRDKAARP